MHHSSVRLRLACTLIFLPSFVLSVFSQPDSLGNYYRKIAEKFSSEEQYDSSLHYYQQALVHFSEERETLSVLHINQALIAYYFSTRDPINARNLTIKNWDLAQEHLDLSLPVEAIEYGRMAADRAALYRWEEDYISAVDLYEKAFNIFEEHGMSSDPDLAHYYNDAGIGYRLIGDHRQAIRYYKKLLQILDKAESLSVTNKLLQAYNNLGVAFKASNNPDSSLFYFKKGIALIRNRDELSNQEGITALYLSRGTSMSWLQEGNLDSALFYSQRAIELVERSQDLDKTLFTSYTREITFTRIVLASIFLKKNQPSKAKIELAKCENTILNESEKLLNETTYYYHYYRGILARIEGNYARSVSYLNKALTLCSNSNSAILTVENTIYPFRALKALSEKIQTEYARKSPESYSEALKDVELAISISQDLRKSFQAEGSKLDLAQISHKITEYGLLTYDALERTELKKDASASFDFIEANKSNLLFEALLEKEALLGLSPTLRAKELRYKRDIAYFQKVLRDYQKGKENNEGEADQTQEKLFTLEQQYNYFKDTLEQNYPSYYKQKYQFQLAKLGQIQHSLASQQAFIQYFMGESHIFVIGIHPLGKIFHKIPLSDSLSNAIEQYSSFLTLIDQEEAEARGEAYISQAFYLYRVLLQPVLNTFPLEVRSLIISPDGRLNYMPFESLLTHLPSGEWRYKDLPYVLKSHSVAYTHSATHWLEQKNKLTQNSANQWLGFAPAYEESQITKEVDQLALNRFRTRDGSVQLPHAQEEIEQISKLTNGTGLFSTSALESKFQEGASTYELIHLATHGIVDDRQPMYSKLVFAPEADSIYDGYLHAYEIYNMQIPADLVVLSACNTGVGKLEKGEGIMSLSRAFFYAGVKSLVMSLWKVSDESTSELMVYFYEGLKEGLPKDQALQQAKIKYMANQDIALKSHPYFWAGFVLKGNAEAIVFHRQSRAGILWAIGMLLFILGIGAYWRWKSTR